MQLTPETLSLALQALQFIWTVSLTVYVALSRSDAAAKLKVEHLEHDMSGLGGRLNSMDERLKRALTLEDLNGHLDKIYEQIRRVDGSLGKLDTNLGKLEGQFTPTCQTVAMIHAWLIESKKNG